MKKILYSVFAIAMAAFTFTSCEDVPSPYDDPNDNPSDEPIVIEPSGDGTAESPYNVARILELAGELEQGESLSEQVYITGVVVGIEENYDSGYGNAEFTIADNEDSNNTFLVYRANYFDNERYSSGPILEFGDSVVVYGTVTNYNGTIETAQNGAYLVYLNGQTGEGNQPSTGEPEGDGTQANPYNVAGVLAYLATFEANEVSENDVYIKGKVASIRENFDESAAQFGNATYEISDDGTDNNTFLVYRSLYLGNTKYTSGQVLKEGDDVVICGKVTNYVGEQGYSTFETVANQSYLYSLESNSGGAVAEGDGSLENPFNAIAAYQYTAALGENETAGPVYIKGIISKVEEEYGTQYGNATYYISADGTFDSADSGNQFYIFRSLYLNNEKYTSGENISVGDEVVVYGMVTNYYGNTPETVTGESYLYSLTKGEGGDEPGGGDISGNSITIEAGDLGLADATDLTTITLSDGTTLTFDAGDNRNGPKYYNNGKNIRMYPNNTMAINSTKTIVGVELTCDEQGSTIYNASGDISSTSGTVNIDGNILRISGASANNVTLTNTSNTNGAASQLRFTSMTIYFAE